MFSITKANQLHFVMLPLMAPGHMIPIIDMAKLIANHGIAVTVVTTPVNAARFRRSIDRAVETGLDIRVAVLEFPFEGAGIPEGSENVDMLPSLSLAKNFIIAACKLQEPTEKLLQELQPQPSCIISDMGFPWTNEVARKFNIPRIVFHGTCCFSLLCLHNLHVYNMLGSANLEGESSLVIPGLPDRITVTKAELPSSITPSSNEMYEFRKKMREAESKSFGVVVNSFRELETKYFEKYKEAMGKRVWCIGPVSLCSKDNLDKGDRGNKTAVDRDECFRWLDSHEPGSVIYACLGSLCDLVPSQIMELGLGLEASNKPFLLVLRGGFVLQEVGKLIDEDGFEERVKGRGLVVRGWAPQVLILSHPAVGGFLTHCGWNSTIEGLSAGVPLITWPLFAEQFLNEKFVTQVLRVGISIKSQETVGGEGKCMEVKAEDVKRAVNLVMEEGEERKGLTESGQRLELSAKTAVEEDHLQKT